MIGKHKLILDIAELLGRLTDWPVEFVQSPPDKPSQSNPDGTLEVTCDNQPVRFRVETKSQVTAAMIPGIINQRSQCAYAPSHAGLLVAPYIPPSIAKELKLREVQYADLKGNLWLKLPDHEIWFKNAARELKDYNAPVYSNSSSSLSAAGVKLIFVLLTIGEATCWPYRQLAEYSGNSIGSVKAAMDWLAQKDYLQIKALRNPGSRKLTRKKELLDVWTEAYGDKLLPKLLIGRYKSAASPNFTQELNSGFDRPFGIEPNIKLSGESAVGLLLGDDYYKPGSTTIYLRDKNNLNQVMAAFKLNRTPRGNVEILEAFWNQKISGDTISAPQLIVYADLMNKDSSRCWNMAKAIYDQQLKRFIEHD